MKTVVAAVGVVFLVFFSQQCHAETRSSRKLLESCSTPQWGQCGGLSCPGGVGCKNEAYACCPSGFGCSRSSDYYWQCLPNAPVVQIPSPSPSPAVTPAITPSPKQSPAPVTTVAPNSPSPSPAPVPVTTTAPVATKAPSTPSSRLCPTTIGDYQQCGGHSNCGSGVNCNNAPWYSAGCCSDGFTCSRGNDYYWQCVPGGASPSPSPAAVQSPSPVAINTPSPAATTAPSNPSPTSRPPATPSTGKPYSWLPDGNYLTTVNDQIIDQNGNAITMHGLAWYGFGNPEMAMVEGLQRPGDSQVQDFATVVFRMKALGFNTIKLPFSFDALYAGEKRPFYDGCQNLASHDTLQKGLTEVGKVPVSNAVFPDNPSPAYFGMACNQYLPSNTMDRFLWVINYFASNGFYVVPDWHPGNPMSNREIFDQPTWQNNYVSFFEKLVKTYPSVVGKLVIDILNEADGLKIRWEANNGRPGLQDIYLNLMPRLFAISKGVPFMIQGAGQANLVNWGDGFVTDSAAIKDNGLSDPNNFFTALMRTELVYQVVLGPHVYGPSVTLVTTRISGPELWNRMTLSFGSKTTTGFCSGGTCKRFPVVLGEYGTSFKNDLDLQLHRDLVAYMHNQGDAGQGHTSINSWIFWAWNPSSSDTGGLVANNWLDIEWNKVDFLTGSNPSSNDGLNLKPWFYGP